ncbi:MAG TPA: hypothetical protein DDX91_10425 [Ruminococcaceae bacterium]|nr:hypothetical protein [Oscillospiraceae bacterium]
MNLDDIRKQIDSADSRLLELFSERMELCRQVAEYKKEKGMPVFQSGREKEVLNKIASKAPAELEAASRLLFSQIMEISKCLQREQLTEYKETVLSEFKKDPSVACPGIKGSYSEEACIKAFGDNARIDYYDSFKQVFDAVSGGRADYGVVPIENSTAGSVESTYKLLEQHEMYICGRLSIPVNHILAVRDKSKAIEKVISHEQALRQCSGFLDKRGYKQRAAENTSIAAKTVSESGESIACICSAHCAKLYGLEIAAENIADIGENFTRFVIISKELQAEKDADIISVCLSLPHISGSLYKLLTRFYFSGLNLTRIESRHMPPHIKKKSGSDSFEVIFYLDFEGSISNPSVNKLLQNLKADCGYYRLLGNYKEIL